MLFLNSGADTGFIYSLLNMVAIMMALFVAMPFHEFAHAAAAKREGDFTAVAYRRYTLALHKHFDLKGFIFLFLFGFGWAKPVPVDERNFKRGKKSKLIVSSAGIVTNLILGTFFLFIYMFLVRFFPSVFEIKYFGYLLLQFLFMVYNLNFMLAFFNLLPIYPLDGFKICESFCRYDNKFLDFMRRNSFWIFLVVALSGLYSYFYMYTGGLLVEGLVNLFSLILGL